jgi:hypothetical protein
MKALLEWSIRIFWGCFGSLAIVAAISFVRHRFHHPQPIDHYFREFLAAFFLIIAVTIFTAYFAVFRFSSALVRPTVFVVSLILWGIASHAITAYLQPLVERSIQSSPSTILPVLALFASIFAIVAAVGYYRATVRILRLELDAA